MANQDFNAFNRAGTIADQATFDVGLRAHMIRVYNYMASGLALSGIVAFGLFSSPELAGMFFQLQAGRVVGLNMLGWIAIFAPLGLSPASSFFKPSSETKMVAAAPSDITQMSRRVSGQATIGALRTSAMV